jgi:hypothetical protein
MYQGQAIFNEPVAFPTRPSKHREICTPLTFEILAGLLASDSRISMRAARHAPGSPLEGKTGFGTSKGLVEC